jgi:hypothetical protein
MKKLSKKEQAEADRMVGEQIRLGWAEAAKLIRQGKRSRVTIASARRDKQGVVFVLMRPGWEVTRSPTSSVGRKRRSEGSSARP